MKPTNHLTQKLNPRTGLRGFTLMETVIAILVLAVLLTGFLTVFTPAAQGIRRAISTQQADRLKATLEKDMATLREGEKTDDIATGFDKAFTWIKEGNSADTAIFVYQYRGNKALPPREDGTLQPMTIIQGKPGIDYVTQTAARRASDPLFSDDNSSTIDDLDAVVGPVFYVKPTQLVYVNNELVLSDTPGQIKNPEDGLEAATPDVYTDAVITFSASFYMVPSISAAYLRGQKFKEKFDSAAKPVFVRNLAVRR